MDKCLSCKTIFDAVKEKEICMGSVACPNCKTPINQSSEMNEKSDWIKLGQGKSTESIRKNMSGKWRIKYDVKEDIDNLVMESKQLIKEYIETRTEPKKWTDESGKSVYILYTGVVLDKIYGKGKWYDIPYKDRNEKLLKWIDDNNALYFPWGGPSYMRLAKENEAAREAIKNNKKLVVIEPLS